MAFTFGDGFDSYATIVDATAGYWDGGNATASSHPLVAGRFAGSQAVSAGSAGIGALAFYKISAVNDAVHHITLAFRQTATVAGVLIGWFIQLLDGATPQCTVEFRQDGAILLVTGAAGGATLATYAGAVTANNTWFAFEIEVVIHNTAGSISVRKNGNTSNDFTLGSLNTRGGTANNYANRVGFGMYNSVVTEQIDDILWRSDASSVPWIGDVRCYTRVPASDASTTFAKSPATLSVSGGSPGSIAVVAGTARYTPQQIAPCDGALTSVTVIMTAGYTGNMKCAIYAPSPTNPGTVLATATPIVNPVLGSNTFTFPTPVSLLKGAGFFVAFDSDTSSGTWSGLGSTGFTSTTPYASFPAAGPALTPSQATLQTTSTFTPAGNYLFVNETIQDGTTTYVYSSNPTDADFYTVAPLAGTPAAVIAVVTRGFLQKSDAGTRGAAVQIKSGGTTVASTATLLGTNFGWLYRTDVVDPATGAAWTPVGVNNVQIGPVVTS